MSDGGLSDEGAAETPRADWYPDPGGSGYERYWDGTRWTDQTRAPGSGAGATSPFGQPSPPFGQPSPGFQQPPAPYQQTPQPYQPTYVSPKSPVLAVVLTIVWIGAGHFYAGRTDTTAIVLVVVNAVLWMLFLFCLVGILGWIPLVIWASIDARKTAIEFNRRHGLQTST